MPRNQAAMADGCVTRISGGSRYLILAPHGRGDLLSATRAPLSEAERKLHSFAGGGADVGDSYRERIAILSALSALLTSCRFDNVSTHEP
jgi:hypothetical protein